MREMTIDQTITPLEEQVNQEYAVLLKRQKNQRQEFKDKMELLPKLPARLLDRKWDYFFNSGAYWYLGARPSSTEEADSIKNNIPYTWTPSFNKHNNTWEYTATLILADKTTIQIHVEGGSKPPTCKVVAKKEWKEVITYESICDGTEVEGE